MKIKAIETRYKGYKFRSRLEARWAVFFDTLGVKWEYEKEGYRLSNGKCYLPDFWLPFAKLWIEIKGEKPDDDYVEMLRLFSEELSCQTLLLVGLPTENYATCFSWCWVPKELQLWDSYMGAIFFSKLGKATESIRVKGAVEAAKSARFEHGA